MKTMKGTCHCKAVEFEVDLANGFENVRRCNCSLCSKKGAVMAGVPLEGLRVTRGEDTLSLYQWNARIAKHYFCSICGIYTHHQRRSVPTEFGFNVACIEGVDLADLGPIGASNGAGQSVVEAAASHPGSTSP
ncbi:GFA family protein [Lysobacter sp. A3-1-A15]|uniref:GFA family protein n=1 Tax=Novilysobacter viscosus TaxID=3098602 RepID=UPI002ED86183